MKSNWKMTTVGDQVMLQRGIDITRAEQRPGSVPVISSGGLSSYHDTAAAKGPGVILGRKGVVGSVWYSEKDYWPHDTTLYVKDFKGNDPRFVYYFFKWKAPALSRLDVGSANPTLNRNHVHPMQIEWPPLPDQKRIAEVLASLDDKIELNRKMNETLEQMARAIFKSWFIDFDPVHAKRQGKKPFGMDDATTSLFPDSFEQSELGEIPRGWKVSLLRDMVKIGRGASPRPIHDYMNGEVPWFKIADATATDGPFILSTKERVKRSGAEKSVTVRPGDLILSNSASLGIPKFVGVEGCIHDGWLWFVDYKVITPKFLYFKFSELAAHLEKIADGTVQKNLNTELIGKQTVVMPPPGLMTAFTNQSEAVFSLILANMRECETLAATRDLLLPRLLSGELTIKGATA